MMANPPQRVYVRLTSSASARGEGTYDGSGTATADDGQYHPAVITNLQFGQSALSSGKRLVQREASSGLLTFTCTLAAVGQTTATQGCGAMVTWDFTTVEDPRCVNISSSIDPTYRREIGVLGVPVGVANVPDDIGTLRGDTRRPATLDEANQYPYSAYDRPLTVSFRGAYGGNWATNSEYHWYSAMTASWGNGTFKPDPIADLWVSYYCPPASKGTVDHMNLRCYDSADAAVASANYYLHFHDPYEDWNTTLTVNHPLPLPQTGPVPDDWTLFTIRDNATSQTITSHFNIQYTMQLSESATIGGEVVGQLTDPAGFLQAKASWSITSTTAVTCSISTTDDVPIAPYKRLTVYVAPTWTYYEGTTSKWGLHGYAGEPATTGTRVPNINGQASLSFGYRESPLPE